MLARKITAPANPSGDLSSLRRADELTLAYSERETRDRLLRICRTLFEVGEWLLGEKTLVSLALNSSRCSERILLID